MFRSLLVLLFIQSFVVVGLHAGPVTLPDLKDLPQTVALRGDAFVEAWLSLRNNLDSLARSGVHPDLLNQWFDAMPGFLVRDAAGLATDPAVLLEAARRLETLEGEASADKIDPARRALRRFFPHHYRVFEDREQSAGRFEIDDGIYAIWIRVMTEAVDLGARTSDQVIATIKTEMNDSSKSDEVRRRYLKALVDFWRQVDRRISNTASVPTWPKHFDEAIMAVRLLNQSQSRSPKDIERGVSAAISLCLALGKNLGYDRLASGSHKVTVLTSGAGRAFDGNLATSWHVNEGNTLALFSETGRPLKGLFVANFCPQNKGTFIHAIKVTGRSGSSTWTKEINLSLRTNYFQYVELDNKTASRLELEILDIEGAGPSCIAEIRLDID